MPRANAIASTEPGPEEITALRELRQVIDVVVGSLTAKEAKAVRRYYGFDGDGCTHVELGLELGVTRTRAQQIIDNALRRLRHPSRVRFFRPYVGLDTL